MTFVLALFLLSCTGPMGPQGETGESVVGPRGEAGVVGRDGFQGPEGKPGFVQIYSISELSEMPIQHISVTCPKGLDVLRPHNFHVGVGPMSEPQLPEQTFYDFWEPLWTDDTGRVLTGVAANGRTMTGTVKVRPGAPQVKWGLEIWADCGVIEKTLGSVN